MTTFAYRHSEDHLRQPFRQLWCPNEETWMRHALTPDGKFYVCSCGASTAEYIIKTTPS